MQFLDKNTIKLDKVESELDSFTLEFTKTLSKYSDYVLVSGYIAILFGRNRASEDIDIFIPKITEAKLKPLIEELDKNGFWILNEDNDGVHSLLNQGLAVRFAKKGTVEPNAEVKFAKKSTDFYSLENKISVILKSGELLISPIEMNIAYKLFLSSQKDVEDARFLFKLFREKLDMKNLEDFVKLLKVEDSYKKYLKD
ncbi:MAG: hypothetical protein HY512_04010 [Candidatus Aenigmarchaeota archaeon]|nr:hypothetical protein [Candidatus Aenigmarchaeota archaeon]